ncbi:hypothetical protein CP970_44015 [Streptomyces kanamyceticus]|uniref:TniQ protein n=1 Tax=Streptomyces kanamyceticus TaxID=1967 RepID=A0A5J6GNH9_STRKN|nr:hypothetical protein CP970_44015 [Streptomyces kanamyceticus]
MRLPVNQTALAAPWRAAPDTARGSTPVAGAWAHILPPAAGVFRVRPLPYEATASYLKRLAGIYRLTLSQLLDGCGITLNGHGTPPTAELALSPAAAHHITILGRIPMAHLTHALPWLPHPGSPGPGPTAHWKPLDALHRPVAACTLCTRRHSQGTTGAAWVHRPWHQLVCPRHHQAAPDPRLDIPVHTKTVPELVTAHHSHRRLLRHPRGKSAWMTARAITTRWYDQQQHLTERWHHRLNQLSVLNMHLDRVGNASAVLLARDLVIYPETVILARALAALPRYRTQRPSEALTAIGHRLGLSRFAPTTSDALATYLTHTRR